MPRLESWAPRVDATLSQYVVHNIVAAGDVVIFSGIFHSVNGERRQGFAVVDAVSSAMIDYALPPQYADAALEMGPD